MNEFIKITTLYTGVFDNIERIEDQIINLHHISIIYDDGIMINGNRYIKLTTESIEKLKKYIKYDNCTGRSNNEP